MKKKIIFLVLTVFIFQAKTYAQLLTWSPQFPADNSNITVVVDGTKGNLGLSGHTLPVYMHIGVITNLSTTATDWKYVTTAWGTTTAPTAINIGPNKWLYAINNPRTYFGVPVGETILKIALLFRNADGTKVQKNTDGTDMYVPIYPAGSNNILFTTPAVIPNSTTSNEPITAGVGQAASVTATASTTTGTLNLYFNGAKIAGPVTGTATINGNGTATQTGNQQFIAELIINNISYYDTIQYFITPPTVVAPLPAGTKEGINYGNDCTSATLVLYAPNKTSSMLIGDFSGSNWMAQPQYLMNKTPDGNYYWITVNGLTAGTEYAFQYLVDNSIYVADPYTEKILDPYNDQYIPAETYPNLKQYPTNSNVTPGKNGLVGILQTCAPQYEWKAKNYVRPDKKNLMTYELLVRDFGDEAPNNYQLLIDSFNYFKRLGINALELMPVNEFAGNLSWGYNPTFYCALDKAYGTKNKFKELVDLCHQNGIAIIVDVVYNHLDAFSTPQGKLYWNAATGRPAANSPWFNVTATHPYSVFEDFNHTTTATQYLVKRSLEYWLTEYKVDGFRFDLAKGFSQKQTNGATVEDYDQQRVDNLNRYYDHIISVDPTAYVILEFLGTQRAEEQTYANKGYLLWGSCHGVYNQATMGKSGSNISKIVYNSGEVGFTTPAQMGYMESHDEERLMYKNLTEGNSFGGFDVKLLSNALQMQAAAAAVFFTVPGPKMFWQFGERGYDLSINRCENGTLSGDCRLSNKPPRWEYMNDVNRLTLFNTYSKLINLRLGNPNVFNNTSFSFDFYDNNGPFKRFQIADPNANGVKITAIANFDVAAQTRSVTFQTTGNWFNYVANGTGAGVNGGTNTSLNVASAAQNITLQPGEYHVYLYHLPTTYMFIGKGDWNNAANWTYNTVPPTTLPGGSEIIISPAADGECVLSHSQTISSGGKITVTSNRKLRVTGNLTIQ